ncbi:MAG: hypothetical protein ACK5L5_07255 [Bacteroidales bacterium]
MKQTIIALLTLALSTQACTTCPPEKEPYTLQKNDITIEVPPNGFQTQTDQLFTIEPITISDEGVNYQWLVDYEEHSTLKNFEKIFDRGGRYNIQLQAKQANLQFNYNYVVLVEETGEVETIGHVNKVFDYLPAVGQFTNKLPKYDTGNTQADMNAKALQRLQGGQIISLGGWGGYVVVGFDKPVKNTAGYCDIRIKGNPFTAAANPDPNAPKGGSFEPGIIMVMQDANENGQPDDQWYELQGSAHHNHTKEAFYQKGVNTQNDMNFYTDYQMTYHRPDANSTNEKYIRWTDNKGNSGYKAKSKFHEQSPFPQWVKNESITFSGTRLPQNGINESNTSTHFVLYKFHYGYADNSENFDIDWAVDNNGNPAKLNEINFVKVYSGVNQEIGQLGGCSTEIKSFEDMNRAGILVKTENETKQ